MKLGKYMKLIVWLCLILALILGCISFFLIVFKNKKETFEGTNWKEIKLPINNVPYQIFVVWFGQDMNKTRKKCFESIKKLGVPVILITKYNLHEWVKKDEPLHPAFYYLSGIHRSDYLRCYLLHHYGGGYSDIKYYNEGTSWVESFDKINKDGNIYLLGSQEVKSTDIACPNDYFHRKKSDKQWNCKIVKKNYKNLVSVCNFICRPKTQLTYDWKERLHNNLSEKLLELIKHPPPTERCCFSKENGYPFRWAESLAEIAHPLQYIYNEHVKNGLPSFNRVVEYGEEGENKPKDNPFTVLDLPKLRYNIGIHKIFYINLDHRTDRKEKMEKQLVNYNIPYERFNAIKTKGFGALGCTKSHTQVLKLAMEQNLNNVLILEDDFDFIVNRNAFETIMTTIFNTNFDWDVIMLTANMGALKSTKVSQPYLKKVDDAQIAAAYIVNGHYIPKLFNRLNEGAKLLEKRGKKSTPMYINDQYWKYLQKKDNWYITNPMLGIQREDYSDIEEKNVKYY